MRVLVASAWPPWPLTDGAALVLHHHLRHLTLRHRVTLVAAARPPGARVPAPDEAGVGPLHGLGWFGPARRGAREYARRRWAGLRSGEPADVFRVELPELVDAFDAAVRSERPDVVHLHGWGTARLARRSPVPAIHVAIDAWQAGLSTQFDRPAWRRVLETGEAARVARHERRHYPASRAVVVVAPRDADLLREAVAGARVDVVPNGVEPGPEPGPPAEGAVLGFHGTLSTVVNRTAAAALVRDVLPAVRARRPDARVVLIGRDPPAQVQALAGPHVEVTGAVADVRVPLAGVAVYVAPVTIGSGLKNKVLEAMAAGLPVVATPLALDGIGPGPGVVVAETPAAIAEAAVALLEDPAARRDAGAAARERVVRDFSWERSATAVEALWSEVATPSAAHGP